MQEVDPRFKFAAERTMLAWIRTGLAFMGFGFIVARFSDSLNYNSGPAYTLEVGVALILMGVGMTFFSSLNYHRSIERIKRNESILDSSWSMGRIVSVLLSMIGIFMVYHLISARR